MNILFNASNLKIGGGIQKAYEFVDSVKRWGQEHNWMLLLSSEVAANLTAENRASNIAIEIFDRSPARRVGGGRIRARFRMIESRFQPDVVFTLLGPSYIRFKAPHVSGYAVPWLTQPADRRTWRRFYPGWKALRMRLWLLWQKRWIRGHDAYVCETDVDADGLAEVLSIPRESIHVIPNSCSSIYLEKDVKKTQPHPALAALPSSAKVLLTFAGAHPHKNHTILPEVARSLKAISPATDWRMVVTLPEGPWGELRAKAKSLGVADSLLNIGPLRPVEGPSLYVRADVMLLPTLMEVFSASYPEAMAMGVPIVTSDRSFAHDVCGEAALFADPFDGDAIAEAIVSVVEDSSLRKRLVEHGRERLKAFGTAQQRFQTHLEIFRKF